jgi:hypothetical protein
MIIVLAVAGTIDLYWYDTARYTSIDKFKT